MASRGERSSTAGRRARRGRRPAGPRRRAHGPPPCAPHRPGRRTPRISPFGRRTSRRRRRRVRRQALRPRAPPRRRAFRGDAGGLVHGVARPSSPRDREVDAERAGASHQPTVSQDRYRVGDVANLRQAVRDVDDRRCRAISEVARRPKSRSRVVRREGGGRLVEDEHAGARSERALAISTSCCAPTLSEPTGTDGSRSTPMSARAARVRSRRSRQRMKPRRPLGSRCAKMFWATVRLGNSAELLVDGADAGLDRLRGVGEGHRPAVQHDATGVRPHHAAHDVHERRLARAVLANQRVNQSRADRKRDLVEHAVAAVGLRHSFDGQDRIAHARFTAPRCAAGAPRRPRWPRRG